MNPEGLPFFINPSVLRTPPLYFAVQNAGEEGESNPPLIADSINSFYCFCFNPLALRALPLYSLTETPRKATGHGRGEGEMYFPFASAPILYATPRNATGHGKGGVWE